MSCNPQSLLHCFIKKMSKNYSSYSHCPFSLQYNHYFLNVTLKLELIIKSIFSFVITYTSIFHFICCYSHIFFLFALRYNFFFSWKPYFFRNDEKCYEDWSFDAYLRTYFIVRNFCPFCNLNMNWLLIYWNVNVLTSKSFQHILYFTPTKQCLKFLFAHFLTLE